jgi:uncharacterized membrane protein
MTQPVLNLPRFSGILRNKFVAGLVILIPIVLTGKALWALFAYVDGLAQPLAERVLGQPIPGIGFATTIAIIFLTGLLFSWGPLHRLLEGLEDLLDAVPLAGTVYGTTKKVLSGFGDPDSQEAFKRFVFVRLPGRTTPGFVTGSFTLTSRDGAVFTLLTVYVPTNHLYVGDVVIVPTDDVIETELTVEDGVSLVLSAGASVPATLTER